ncbi:MAG: acyltransferase family protein [Alphaproteobacteria bacterium]
MNQPRIDWVDYAKGICIVLVVMMHSTLGVGVAAGSEGWLHQLVWFAAPFRMPDFFLIAGVFLARVIDRPWSNYTDRKVLHFAYFYVLWLVIQFAFKTPGFVAEFGAAETARLFALSFIQPFGTMWFIYALPIFFVVTKLLRTVPVAVIFVAAAALEMSDLHTGWILIDEFASRYVYFFAGYAFAPTIFRLAAWVGERISVAAAILVVWALANGAAVAAGIAGLPLVSLALGFAGAVAIVAISVLLSRFRIADLLRYAGEHSLVIYLGFFLPMAIGRVALIKTGIISDIGSISLLVTLGGVIAPLILYWIVRDTFARFLFERPLWARPTSNPVALAPAE